MPGHRPIRGFRGPVRDDNIGGDMTFRLALGPGAGFAQGPPSPQCGHEFTLQRPAPLNIERLVDRFMGDSHTLIIREVDP
ncbi:hypothetical protein FRC0291_00791 [Corynebacterium diphtheriae]|nr:hypothetical protein FRC0291_00791 [Corynebacterium diphtheriae]